MTARHALAASDCIGLPLALLRVLATLFLLLWLSGPAVVFFRMVKYWQRERRETGLSWCHLFGRFVSSITTEPRGAASGDIKHRALLLVLLTLLVVVGGAAVSVCYANIAELNGEAVVGEPGDIDSFPAFGEKAEPWRGLAVVAFVPVVVCYLWFSSTATDIARLNMPKEWKYKKLSGWGRMRQCLRRLVGNVALWWRSTSSALIIGAGWPPALEFLRNGDTSNSHLGNLRDVAFIGIYLLVTTGLIIIYIHQLPTFAHIVQQYKKRRTPEGAVYRVFSIGSDRMRHVEVTLKTAAVVERRITSSAPIVVGPPPPLSSPTRAAPAIVVRRASSAEQESAEQESLLLDEDAPPPGGGGNPPPRHHRETRVRQGDGSEGAEDASRARIPVLNEDDDHHNPYAVAQQPGASDNSSGGGSRPSSAFRHRRESSNLSLSSDSCGSAGGVNAVRQFSRQLSSSSDLGASSSFRVDLTPSSSATNKVRSSPAPEDRAASRNVAASGLSHQESVPVAVGRQSAALPVPPPSEPLLAMPPSVGQGLRSSTLGAAKSGTEEPFDVQHIVMANDFATVADQEGSLFYIHVDGECDDHEGRAQPYFNTYPPEKDGPPMLTCPDCGRTKWEGHSDVYALVVRLEGAMFVVVISWAIRTIALWHDAASSGGHGDDPTPAMVAKAAAVTGLLTGIIATLSDASVVWQRYTYLASQCTSGDGRERDAWLRGYESCDTTAALPLHEGYSLTWHSMLLGPAWCRGATVVRCLMYAWLDSSNSLGRLVFALAFLVVDLIVSSCLLSPAAVFQFSRWEWRLPLLNTVNFVNQAVLTIAFGSLLSRLHPGVYYAWCSAVLLFNVAVSFRGLRSECDVASPTPPADVTPLVPMHVV